MTRNFIAVAALLVCGVLVAGFTVAQTTPASFSSKQLTVSNIDPKHFSVQLVDGTFSFRGLPTLHAVLPEKHLTLDAARVDGTIDQASRVVKTAKLTGGVKGSLESVSTDGAEHFTFSGPIVTYTNAGAADEQNADIDVSGGATFGSVNDAAKRTLFLKGSHGFFQVRSKNGVGGLTNADLDGPVAANFSGQMLSKDKAKATPVSGKATCGHLTVRPAGTGFVIRMSGGVALHGTTGAIEGVELHTAAINI